VGEALVVAEVEVGLCAVVGDKDFAVLEGRHGSGIDVEVGVELHHVDLDARASSRQPMEAAARPCRAKTQLRLLQRCISLTSPPPTI